jgi:dsDNA-specific endonuclease/ATPase MutS2
VRRLLGRLDFIERFHDAPEQAGGWGATIVFFRARF